MLVARHDLVPKRLVHVLASGCGQLLDLIHDRHEHFRLADHLVTTSEWNAEFVSQLERAVDAFANAG